MELDGSEEELVYSMREGSERKEGAGAGGMAILKKTEFNVSELQTRDGEIEENARVKPWETKPWETQPPSS